MKLGFIRRGEKGFTLIEIIIVLSVLAILAAVIVPNVSGYLGRAKERGWAADRDILQSAVDSYRTDISKRSGNRWPTQGQTSENRTVTVLGVPALSASTTAPYTVNVTAGQATSKGIIDIGVLVTEKYLKSTDAVKSANRDVHTGATNLSGSYIWYIDTNGVVHSVYNLSDPTTGVASWKTDFQTDIYP